MRQQPFQITLTQPSADQIRAQASKWLCQTSGYFSVMKQSSAFQTNKTRVNTPTDAPIHLARSATPDGSVSPPTPVKNGGGDEAKAQSQSIAIQTNTNAHFCQPSTSASSASSDFPVMLGNPGMLPLPLRVIAATDARVSPARSRLGPMPPPPAAP